jgi:alpha-D-xyloside xylohydrolase
LEAIFRELDGALVASMHGETLRIDPWGPHSLRVRSTLARTFGDEELSALLPQRAEKPMIEIGQRQATITHGRLRAEVAWVHPHGEPKDELQLRFVEWPSGRELTCETRSHFAWPPSRHFRGQVGGGWSLEATFKAYDDERFYGLGQHQHGLLDQKGTVIALHQKNAEVCIPFAVSSRGYGFLWNNPAIGRVELARNLTKWVADLTHRLDYWVTAGDARQVLAQYAQATGRAPQFPEWGTGFWQCRLRYRNQEELLSVAREHVGRGLPLSCIVIDFFHWTRQGEWRFDPVAWPDPAAMVRELQALGVQVMVSIWPTVNVNSELYSHMQQQGLLLRAERGVNVMLPFVDTDTGGGYKMHLAYYDPSNPLARDFLFERCRESYLAHGIKGFWLDACEPETRPNDPDNLRYHLGNGAEVGNAYPFFHERGFYEGLKREGVEDAILLCRSAWAGSQRYGALVWSGDITSTFEAFQAQVRSGLNMGLSGMGWWTTDIGGFYEGNGEDPQFRELLQRWFAWAVFCPVFRLHGFRIPDAVARSATKPLKPYGTDALAVFTDTGGSNEVWCWGEEVLATVRKFMALRERLRPYVAQSMHQYSETGLPPMRALLIEFPDDPAAVAVDDAYLFGSDLLVAPVLDYQARSRRVYLPRGARWRDPWTGRTHEGGTTVEVQAPLDRIPLFERDGARVVEVEVGG